MQLPVLCFTPSEASKASGLGEKTIYQLIKTRTDFPVFANGSHYHIPVREFQEWLGTQGKLRTGVPEPLKTWRSRKSREVI